MSFLNSSLNNRPAARTNTQGVVIPDSMIDEAFLGDYQGGVNLIYKGFARPGAPTNQPVWQIAKLAYDGNNNIISIKWPQKIINSTNSGPASNDYEFIWDNRTSLSYI